MKENKPNQKVFKKGKRNKILLITGEGGMLMPPHLSTKEAVIIVQEGEAILEMKNSVHQLNKNDVFIIPGNAVHTLTLKNKFEAIVVMELDSIIEFVN